MQPTSSAATRRRGGCADHANGGDSNAARWRRRSGRVASDPQHRRQWLSQELWGTPMTESTGPLQSWTACGGRHSRCGSGSAFRRKLAPESAAASRTGAACPSTHRKGRVECVPDCPRRPRAGDSEFQLAGSQHQRMDVRPSFGSGGYTCTDAEAATPTPSPSAGLLAPRTRASSGPSLPLAFRGMDVGRAASGT